MNLSFQLLKSIFYCRNVNNNNGNQGFKSQISCLIEERVDNCVHAFRSVFTIENHAGQKTEEESSGNTYKVTCGGEALYDETIQPGTEIPLDPSVDGNKIMESVANEQTTEESTEVATN